MNLSRARFTQLWAILFKYILQISSLYDINALRYNKKRLAMTMPSLPCELPGFPPQIHRSLSSGIILSNPGKFQSLGPFDITTGSSPSASYGYYGSMMCHDRGQLEQRIFWVGCNIATHYCVFVHLCLRKMHLSVESRAAFSSWLRQKGEGWR